MKILTASAACLAMAFAGPALAATDGALGQTSNGSFNVTANISAQEFDSVHVYGLEDLVMPGEVGTPGSTWQIYYCMIRTPNAGDIGVTVSSIAAGDTEFLLKSPGGNLPLIITMSFEDGAQYTQLNEGVEDTFTAPSSCDELNGGEGLPENARMDFTVNGAPTEAGSYSNTFLISISPK